MRHSAAATRRSGTTGWLSRWDSPGVPGLVKQNTAVAAALKRLADACSRESSSAELLGPEGAAPIASEALLLALLRTRVMHDLELERLLTAIRRGLLAEVATGNLTSLEDGVFRFYCNLAQQCFLNEYVYALSDREQTQLQQVQARISDALTTGHEVAVARPYRERKLSAAA